MILVLSAVRRHTAMASPGGNSGGGGWKQTLVRLMERHRGLIVVLFCLPASFLFDVVFRLRAWVRRELLAAPNSHHRRVAEIQARVSEVAGGGGRRRSGRRRIVELEIKEN